MVSAGSERNAKSFIWLVSGRSIRIATRHPSIGSNTVPKSFAKSNLGNSAIARRAIGVGFIVAVLMY